MELNSLPEEKIVEICESLDNTSLVKFIQTSKENYRICNDVLQKREQQMVSLIDQLINIVKNEPVVYGNHSEIKLTSPDDKREFRLQFYPINKMLKLKEKLLFEAFALGIIEEKNITKNQQTFSQARTEQEIKQLLLKLFLHDYLTGDYYTVK